MRFDMTCGMNFACSFIFTQFYDSIQRQYIPMNQIVFQSIRIRELRKSRRFIANKATDQRISQFLEAQREHLKLSKCMKIYQIFQCSSYREESNTVVQIFPCGTTYIMMLLCGTLCAFLKIHLMV
jgi:hypothetical protein